MSKPRGSIRALAFLCFLSCASARPLEAGDWHVAPGGSGAGTASAPFGRIQDGLNAAQPGDTVHVAAGTYNEALRTMRNGTSSQRIVLRASAGRGSVLVTMSGRVLTVAHAFHTVEGLVLDGQYGASDLVRVETAGSGFTLRDAEVRRTSRDGIDIGAPSDVLIDGSLVHHTLNATNGRTDAHGIVAGAARRLTIRQTEVHTFSGDAFQIDPGRSAPGWDEVRIEGCRFWLQPLPAPVNGFAAGVVPGENAVDTKVGSTLARPKLMIRNTEAFGFRAGLIGNMAAFNIKERVDAIIDGVTVHSSEIAFRLRAPADVGVQNAVVHSVGYGVRYEDDIQNVRIYNSTFGSGVARAFVAASSSGSVLDVQNVAILAASLPPEANGGSNLAMAAAAFVDAARHNYQLADTSPAIDRGMTLSGVTIDRNGAARPQGTAYDVGAYERIGSSSNPDPSAGADIVLHAWKAPTIVGTWTVVTDTTAAGGARIASPNQGAPAVPMTHAHDPSDYFEMSFSAEAGRPYRLWIRGRAEKNSVTNDSVYVQFSESVDAAGAATYRIGTTGATMIGIQYCAMTSCYPSGWGWRDNSTSTTAGALIYFARSGRQTIRIQRREDGMSIDQIVLSPSTYLTVAPGPMRKDATILPEAGG